MHIRLEEKCTTRSDHSKGQQSTRSAHTSTATGLTELGLQLILSSVCACCSPNPLLADDSPAHWEPLDDSTKAHGNTSLVLLSKDKHSDELAEVVKNFERTGPKGVIKTVHRVQNKSILANYLRKREEMVERGIKRGKPSDIRADLIVFHGTRVTPPSKIHASPSGFDPSLGKSAPNWLWFASEARYSAQGFAHSVMQDKMPFYGPGQSEMNLRGIGCQPQVGLFKQIFQVRITMDCNPPPPQPSKAKPDRFGVVQNYARQCLVGPVRPTHASHHLCGFRTCFFANGSRAVSLSLSRCWCAQNIYTLMDGHQCLPEYLITFTG